MFLSKRYKISEKKKEELEKELLELETTGREQIASRLDLIRQQPIDEEDYPFADVYEDQESLEQKIFEIKDILKNSEIINNKEKHTKVELGSKVKVSFEKFQEVYTIVSSVEADPLNKMISDDSPIGHALLGAKIGDTIEVKIGNVNKTFRVLKIS